MVIMTATAKIVAESAETAVGLSEEDIDDIIVKAVAAAVSAVKKELTDILNSKLDGVLKDLKAKDEEILQLQQEKNELWIHVNRLILRQDAIEAYSRVDNITIHGPPLSFSEVVSNDASATDDTSIKNLKNEESHFESKAEYQEDAVFNFCHELQIDLQQSDIATCHRLPKSARTKYAPQPIRFTNRKIRSRVLGARKQLRETKKEVYINEHLTKTTSDIFAAARRLQKDRKILQTWTTNRKVMVKLLDNKTKPIFSKSDLAHL